MVVVLVIEVMVVELLVDNTVASVVEMLPRGIVTSAGDSVFDERIFRT